MRTQKSGLPGIGIFVVTLGLLYSTNVFSGPTVITGDYGTIAGQQNGRCKHNPKNYYACLMPRSKTVRYDARQPDGVSEWWLERLNNAIIRAQVITQPLGWRWVQDHTSDDFIDIEYLPAIASLPGDTAAITQQQASSADCSDNGFFGTRTKGICKSHQANIKIDSTKVWLQADEWGLDWDEHGFLLESIILHELMHALGLGHSDEPGTLMYSAHDKDDIMLWDITAYEKHMLEGYRP